MDVFHLSGKTATRTDRLMSSVIGVISTSIIYLSSFVGILSNLHDLVAGFLIYSVTLSSATGLKLLSSGASLHVGWYKGLSFKASLILFIFSIK